MKIDLHTHSTASPDGGISADEYRQVISSGRLDCVAITDHNTIELALKLHQELGHKVIVGEEITTTEGEIIGLFLTKPIAAGQTAAATVAAIEAQNGLVYIPHPFETVRQGVSAPVLDSLASHQLIIEVHNGRAFAQNRSPEATTWASLHHKPKVASSDAHGTMGLGSVYTVLDAPPNRDNLISQLAAASFQTKRPPLYSLLYPTLNRLRKKLQK